jgi:serine phosphatase RsbU (regulator of sigma subunit)
MLLYTDGVTESRDPWGGEYGIERLRQIAGSEQPLTAQALTSACLSDLTFFRSGRPKTDDLTVMVLQRVN